MIILLILFSLVLVCNKKKYESTKILLNLSFIKLVNKQVMFTFLTNTSLKNIDLLL